MQSPNVDRDCALTLSHEWNPDPFDLFVFFFFSLGLCPQHMEVPRLGAELELQPPAYATATAMPDQSHICDLHHSSEQCWILNPLSKTRDQTLILMDSSRVR